jgi:GTP cyclohydrolase I
VTLYGQKINSGVPLKLDRMSKELNDKIEEVGDNHFSSSLENPIAKDAFDKSDEDKIEIISQHFREIMKTIGLDLTDDSLQGTPRRVAKMYVKELFSGLNPVNEPAVSLFENNYEYDGMLVEKDINLNSLCEHHFVPIVGKVHVAYFANGNVIGLSKINRIVEHFARRPQVQERLTMQIVAKLQDVLGTDDVACIVDAKHFCVSMRGVKDCSSSTITSQFKGRFTDPSVKAEFLAYTGATLPVK